MTKRVTIPKAHGPTEAQIDKAVKKAKQHGAISAVVERNGVVVRLEFAQGDKQSAIDEMFGIAGGGMAGG